MAISYLQASGQIELSRRPRLDAPTSLLGRMLGVVRSWLRPLPPQLPPAPVRRRRYGARAYDGALESRATDGWSTNGSSANAENYSAVAPLRERARDLRRNNSWIKNGCQHVANIMVGDGIRPHCKAPDGASALQVARCAEANRLWKLQAQRMSTDDDLSVYGLQSMAWMALFSDGEVLQRRRWRSLRDGLPVPFQIELLEADYLADWKNEVLADGGRIVQGIEFNKIGRRRQYWLYKQHPGDGFGPLGTIFTIDAIPAGDVAHGYIRDRPGQVRGICQFASAIIPARNYDDCTYSVRMTYRSASCTLGVISTTLDRDECFGTPDSGSSEAICTGAVSAADGTPLDEMRPASWAVARDATSVAFNNPQAPQGVKEYMRSELHGVAAAMQGLPYALLTGDMDGTTYATWRANYAQCLETCKNIRALHFIPTVCRPQWIWFLEGCFAAGQLDGAVDDYPVEWSTPKAFGFDPKEEAQTSKDRVRNGLASLTGEIRDNGDDPDVIRAEIVAERKWADDNRIVFDCDPNLTNLAGAPRIGEKAIVPAPAE